MSGLGFKQILEGVIGFWGYRFEITEISKENEDCPVFIRHTWKIRQDRKIVGKLQTQLWKVGGKKGYEV